MVDKAATRWGLPTIFVMMAVISMLSLDAINFHSSNQNANDIGANTNVNNTQAKDIDDIKNRLRITPSDVYAKVSKETDLIVKEMRELRKELADAREQFSSNRFTKADAIANGLKVDNK